MLGSAYIVVFFACIVIANGLLRWVPNPVDVGLGLTAPVAAYVAGVALVTRDLVQNLMGRRTSVLIVVIGAGASLLIAPSFVWASGIAFLISGLVSFCLFTLICARTNWMIAAAVATAMSIVCDSVVFLTLAFHSLDFLPGQLLAKFTAGSLLLLVLAPARASVALRPV